MDPSAGRWTFAIAMLPSEVEALLAGRRVTKVYPEAIPHGPLPFSLEDAEALRRGMRIVKAFDPVPGQVLRVGTVLGVVVDEHPRADPPGLSRKDLEAVKAGRTVVKPRDSGQKPSTDHPNLRVEVVAYEVRGTEHAYTFEAV